MISRYSTALPRQHCFIRQLRQRRHGHALLCRVDTDVPLQLRPSREIDVLAPQLAAWITATCQSEPVIPRSNRQGVSGCRVTWNLDVDILELPLGEALKARRTIHSVFYQIEIPIRVCCFMNRQPTAFRTQFSYETLTLVAIETKIPHSHDKPRGCNG